MAMITSASGRIWLVLMLATLITTWGLSKDDFNPAVATPVIFLIAAFKVRLVLIHFMELRHAPTLLRLAFEVWLAAVTAAVITLY